MPKPIIYGASIGLLVGVLIGTVGGISMVEEVVMQMVFGLIGGIGVGVCYHILTREKPADEEIVSQTNGGSNIMVWLVPLISIIAAVFKGFMLARMNQ